MTIAIFHAKVRSTRSALVITLPKHETDVCGITKGQCVRVTMELLDAPPIKDSDVARELIAAESQSVSQ